MLYWIPLNQLKSAKYSLKHRSRRTRTNIVFKYRRVSSKKIIKKVRTSNLLRILQLNFLFNTFTNTPPLSTLLNLVGVNVQKFCEDLNKELKLLDFLGVNVLVKFRLYILKNLNYEYSFSLHQTHFLKNSNFLSYFQKSSIENIILLNNLRDVKLRIGEELFSKRFFFNVDLFFVNFFFFNLQDIFFRYNMRDSFFTPLLKERYDVITFEKLTHRLLSNIYTLNLKLIKHSVFLNK